MSHIYPPTRQGKIAMFQDTRAVAMQMGDNGMVRAMNAELASLGALETTLPVDVMETAVPAKPRRGRRPLPRCEHDMIAARCPVCNEEMGA